jgi:nucleolar protein 56
VKGLEDGDLCRAQLGLAHSYSRSKVKFNVNRCTAFPTSFLKLLDQLV